MLVLMWMITVFIFSNQPANVSQNTSLKTTKEIVEISNREKSVEEKQILIDSLDPVVRKWAHFTFYTIGGILILNYINTYSIEEKKKILYSIVIGVIYACIDESHQAFIVGRTGKITDVLIDTLGILTGACVFLCAIKTIDEINMKLKK